LVIGWPVYLKKEKTYIRVGACALAWAIWRVQNDYIFDKCKVYYLYAVYSVFYTLDPYVVLPITNGETRGFDYWVQPAREGCTGFIQPVQLAFWSLIIMVMLRSSLLSGSFHWLIHVSTLSDLWCNTL
jgi:hypothetical protein